MKDVHLSETVSSAINEELDYQFLCLPYGAPTETDSGVAAQLVMLDTYIRKAQDAWSHNRGDAAALNEIRKIAALAVRALEEHGCPRRGPLYPPTSENQ